MFEFILLPEFFGLRALSTGGPIVANVDPRCPDVEPGDPPIVYDPDVVDPLRPNYELTNIGSKSFIKLIFCIAKP